MSKGKLSTTIIMAIIFLAFAIFAIVYYFGENYNDFYSNATQEFEVSGLDEGFIPQGLTHENETDTFLVSGYMNDGSASRIYVVDGETNQTEKYFTLAYDNDGTLTDYVGHCGGIATDGNGVWVVGDKTVYYFKYETISVCENGNKIEVESYFTAPNGADFVTIYENKLLVGEFHRDNKYDTDETHFIETASGNLNKAVSFMYEINNNNMYGLESLNPVLAISTPSLVQGMVITDESIILSTSYSLPSSNLYFYDNILNTTEHTQKTFTGIDNAVDTYILDTPTKTIKAPCMSEEIAIKDNSLYVLFENACNKYKYFTRDNLEYVFSLDLDKISL